MPRPAAEVRDASYVLSWEWPDDNGSSITGFELRQHSDTYRTSIDGQESIELVNNYEVTDVTKGDTYSPQVRALNNVGAGLWSQAAIVVPGGVAPEKITGIRAFGNANLVVVLFPRPDTGDAPIILYQYQIGAGNSWITLTGDDARQVQQRGTFEVPSDGLYTFRIRAVSLVGAGPPSDIVEVTAVVPTRLGPPTNLRWEITIHGPFVIWDPPPNTEAQSVLRYEVQVDGGAWIPTGSDEESHFIENIGPGDAHDIRVRAISAVGVGTPSQSVRLTVSGATC